MDIITRYFEAMQEAFTKLEETVGRDKIWVKKPQVEEKPKVVVEELPPPQKENKFKKIMKIVELIFIILISIVLLYGIYLNWLK